MITLLFGFLPQTPIDISAEPRLGSQLAAALSIEGRRVVPDAEVASRGYAVRIKGKPWDEVQPLLERGLGVRFRETAPGELLMEVDLSVRERERSLLALYTNNLDNRIKSGIRTAFKLSPTIPPTPEAMEELDKRFGNPGTGKPDEQDGYAILKGIAGSRAPNQILSGPALAYFERNSVKTLINRDVWRTGDMYSWRDDRTLAPWVRQRAVAFAREAETRIGRELSANADRFSTNAVAEADRKLEAEARGMSLSHRLHFEPKRGEVMFEFSLVKPKLTEAAWSDRGPLAVFSNLLSFETLRDLMPSDADRDALQKRRTAMGTAGLPSRTWKRSGQDTTVSGALLAYAESENKDLVMEIFPNRDVNLQILQSPDATSGKFPSLGAFLGFAGNPGFDLDMRPVTRAVAGLNAEQTPTGGLLVTNEMAFMDRTRPLPMDTVLAVSRIERERRTLLEFAAESAKLDDNDVQKLAAAEAFPARGFVASYPVLRWVDRLPDKDKQAISKALRESGSITFSSRLGNGASRLGQQISEWMQGSPWYGPRVGSIRTVTLHPTFAKAFADGSEVQIDQSGGLARITVWIKSGTERVNCYEATLNGVNPEK